MSTISNGKYKYRGNNMIINTIPFENGSLETMIDRLYKTMNSMDKGWSKKTEPASQSQIQTLANILEQHGRSIPLAYRFFLQSMGKNDNGLLEQEWDGYSEVNSDTLLENYSVGYNDFVSDGFLPFSFHWADAILSMKLSESDNPPIYCNCYDELFSGSFENYLFQMAFRRMKKTQFLYQVDCATSKAGFCDILKKLAQNLPWTKPMEFIESILKPYQLQKAWFSDDVRFYGISFEYIISVDLHWALNITISSNNHIAVQNMKKSLTSLFGSSLHWK